MVKTIKFNYRLIDLYEGYDIIGYTGSENALIEMAENWIEETDGECWLKFEQLNCYGKWTEFNLKNW